MVVVETKRKPLTFADQSWGFVGLGKTEAVGKFSAIFNFRR